MVAKNSVIDSELENLNKQIDAWWYKEGPMKVLHSVNPIKNHMMLETLMNIGNISEKQFKSAKPFAGLKVLDAGCGGGLCTESLARLGAEVVGIDPSKPMIKLAKFHASLDESDAFKNLQYLEETVEEHSIKNEGKYDIVISCGVLEHLTEYDLYLRSCVKCLKKGGSIFVSTFNKTFWAWLIGKWACEYIFGLIPKGIHDYKLFVAPETVSDVLTKYDCHTNLVEGLALVPLFEIWFRILPQIFYTLHAVKNS